MNTHMKTHMQAGRQAHTYSTQHSFSTPVVILNFLVLAGERVSVCQLEIGQMANYLYPVFLNPGNMDATMQPFGN